MSRIKNFDWSIYHQDWLNLNTGIAISIYACVALISIEILTLGTKAAKISSEFSGLLVVLATLFPALIIVVVFGAYRGAYKGNLNSKGTVNKILAWRRYALPMTILMCITTIFIACFLYLDLKDSVGVIKSGEFAFGAFSFPIYFGTIRIEIPSTIFWFSFIGYLITLIGVMLRRIVTNNLVPHFYIASSFRLIKSLVAALLIILALNGVPQIFTQDTVAGNGSSGFELTLHPFYNILIAFVAGASADDILSWIIYRVRQSIGRGGGEPLSLSSVQGIDPTLEAYLRDEGIDSIQMLATTPRKLLAEMTNISDETIEDWQVQTEFLRNFESPDIVTRFHKLGINEFADLEGVEDEKLSKALVEAGKQKEIDNTVVFEVLINVLKGEGKRRS